MKKIIYLFFTIILLLIIVDYAYPRDSSSDSKTKNDMTAAIEKLIQRIEKNERTNREVIKNFDELNEKLQKTISNEILPKMAEKTLAISKANNDVAKSYYETLKVAAFIIKYVIPFGSIIVLLIFILNFTQIKNIACQLIYKGFRIDERDTKHWAKIFHTQGLFYYNEAL